MSTAGLFLAVAITVGVATFVVWPLIAAPRTSPTPTSTDKPEQSSLAELQADREAILTTLRDLDFDFQTGKLIKEDYHRQREELVARGVETLRHIDALESDVIETAIAARRMSRKSAAKTRASPEDRIEAAVAAQRKKTRVE